MKVKATLLVLIILGCVSCVPTGSRDVRIAVALPPKLDLTQYDYLYFPGFISEVDHERLDTEREVLNFLKSEFKRRGVMEIIEKNPVDLTDKESRSFFVRDQPFFKAIPIPNRERSLALTGVITFEAVDRSGFHEVRTTDVMGNQRTRAEYVEITGFNLSMKVYVYDMNQGKLLYTDLLMDATDVRGPNPDERVVLYDLMQRVSQRALGLFSNTLVRAERSLL